MPTVYNYDACGGQKSVAHPLLFKRAHKQETTYQVWEEGNHPQIIESEAVMCQKLDYIHQNPVKRGYVDRSEHWRYSSARNYVGQEG